MAIKNTDVNDEYPYIFMVNQTIQQRIPDTASEASQYFLTMVLKHYKIENDTIVFDDDSQFTIDIEDFTTETLIAAGQGDMTYADAHTAQQLGICKLVSDHTGKIFEVI